MSLIQEARKRGYRKGVAIQYVPHAVDYLEGDVFEIDEHGNLKAYAKESHERKGFDDWRCDTIYEKSTDTWTEFYNPENKAKVQVFGIFSDNVNHDTGESLNK